MKDRKKITFGNLLKALEKRGLYASTLSHTFDGGGNPVIDVNLSAPESFKIDLTEADWEPAEKVEVPSGVHKQLTFVEPTVKGAFSRYHELTYWSKDDELDPGEEMFLDWIWEDPERYLRAVVNGTKVNDKYYLRFVDTEDGFLNQSPEGSLFISDKEEFFGFKTVFTEEEIKDMDKGELFWEFRVHVDEVD